MKLQASLERQHFLYIDFVASFFSSSSYLELLQICFTCLLFIWSCSSLSLPVWLSRLCIKIVCRSSLKFRMISKVFLDWREFAFFRNLRALVIQDHLFPVLGIKKNFRVIHKISLMNMMQVFGIPTQDTTDLFELLLLAVLAAKF